MPTHPDQWETVKSLFEAALEEDPSHRPSYLAEHCKDPSVRAEVERLLAEYESAGSFLSQPALGKTETRTHGLVEGQVLAGRFQILRYIAGGGMGEVYEADDIELHERVAIKTIRPDILNQFGAVARFKREVHIARKVTHSNVCRIYDLFRHKTGDSNTAPETLFVSMELLYGETLSERLNKSGKMRTEEALPLICQMAAALAAAHSAGVVHRDFKPGNVMLVNASGEERAVVTDFGLALQQLQSEESHSLSTGPGLLGTPTYMAPEQLEGRPATSSSDIYALGLVIYEMVTGVRPFQGDTPMSAAMKRLSEPPSRPRKFEPNLNPLWESVILRCLERDPAKRFFRADDIGKLLAQEQATASVWSARKPRGMSLIAVATLIVLGAAVEGTYFYAHRTPKLTDKDTVVLADFTNTTGDPVFDDTLKTALTVSLRQSPFLNVLSDSQVAKTLHQMTRPASTKITPEVASELCLRAGSKAYIAGSIDGLGREYVLGLKAVNCQSGDTLAQEQVTAASKEEVLDALGEAASKVRSELGESVATVQTFDAPLAQVTTSSLEALKAYSIGEKVSSEKGDAAALPYHLRAIELDPNFAMGYLSVGNDYFSLAELGRASEYLTKAFHLREHASEREKLAITANYYRNVTGQLDKAAEADQEMIQSYPRAPAAYNRLGIDHASQGQYEKATEITRQAVRIAPDTVAWHDNLVIYALALQHFDETRHIIYDVQARKTDSEVLHDALYALAFLGADSAAMAEQQQWFAGKPEENIGLALASDTEAYRGHLGKARELTKRAVDSAIRSDSTENGAIWQANAAVEQAAYGNITQARQSAAEALKLAPTSQGVESEAALAFAMAGDTARAESLAQDLGKRFPLDTQMQLLWLPAIQAQVALDGKNPPSALNALPAASPIEFGAIPFVANISCLYPVYVRGEAYLAVGQANAAAAEFQKILDHNGIVWNCWTGALAHLGVARANALHAKTSQGADAELARTRALAAYKDFLVLWKDADPDIPILKQAKAEYAKLQ
jgi:eukaryotic-like serine/threonine-protein kinase